MTKKFNVKSCLFIYFSFVLTVFTVLSVFRIFNSVNYLLDTYEHIHASWLVSEGLVPYRDFFEHHHPLLWYLFSPVTQLFYRDISVIFIARFIAVSGYLFTLYLVYLLALRFCNSKIGAMLSVLFTLCFSSLWTDIQNLRPDIFMYVSILAALKYFFDYLDRHQLKYLCLSYFLWFVAFLFLQKALIYGAGFALVNVYLLYKKRILLSDFYKALAAPTLIAVLILFILYRSNALGDWYQYNFTFNMIMKNNFGNHHSGISHFLPFCTLLTAFAVIRVFKKSEMGNTFLFVWLFSCLSLLDFAPHPQYYLFTILLSAILLSQTFKLLYQKKTLPFLLVLSVFLIHTIYVITPKALDSSRMREEKALINYVLQNTSKDEKLLSGHYAYNLFNPDTHYYWLEFYTIAILADLYFDKPIDYNEQIKTHRPKFLFIPNIPLDRISLSNSVWLKKRNAALLKKASHGDKKALSKINKINSDYWQIDMDYIKKHYQLINTYGATHLWQRIEALPD